MRSDLPEQVGDLDLADRGGCGRLQHGPRMIGAGAGKEIPRRHATAEQGECKASYLAASVEGQVISRSAAPLPSA
ncbi:hypothetical protein [Novosphingobium gossypii]|uniref:hypothetical protein n=1 Tax=Novosphingobium gossypii TaxID=1604774 RepID=UPI003D1C430D